LQGTENFENFINAVIDEKSFNKLASYIDAAKQDKSVEIIAGGNYDKSVGYFIEPTIIVAQDPRYVTMCEELFGPVLTIHIFDDANFEETLDIVDTTSIYALTGAIIAQDRYAIELATRKLENAAGNFYINDKCTGAVVGQQPFGGARGSGTNDKAGSMINLLRWVSPRTIKETFDPAPRIVQDCKYYVKGLIYLRDQSIIDGGSVYYKRDIKELDVAPILNAIEKLK
jgi:1-pyrroline-5-carboxylate dehydrogenase